MNTIKVLENIAQRCGSDIYLGIMDPIRVGKSTFIREFMERTVTLYVSDKFEKSHMIDELPQAGAGKTITITKPKFVPNNAATIEFDDGFTMSVRLVGCVGYVIPETKGYKDEDGVRMVHTPWNDESVPFSEVAKIDTQKVIQDHLTIGIVVMTDGTISDLPREAYIKAEAEVIDGPKSIGKPFIVVVNNADAHSPAYKAVADKLEEKHEVPVFATAANYMSKENVHGIFQEVLYEFPVSEININMPQWITVLDDNYWLRKSSHGTIQESISSMDRLREVENIADALDENEYTDSSNLITIDIGQGIVNMDITVKSGLYSEILREIIGHEIEDKAELISLMQDHSKVKREYNTVESALKVVGQTGYGFASTSSQDIQLSKSEVVKQGSRYGVKSRTITPSIHMTKVDVEDTFEPIIGSKEQGEELIRYLLRDDGNDDQSIWDSNIFGRRLLDLIRDGLSTKLSMILGATRARLQDILTKLVNKGKDNVIATVLQK